MMMIGWHPSGHRRFGKLQRVFANAPRTIGYGRHNSGNFCNKDLNKLVLASQSETDRAAREAQLRQVEQIAHNEAAFVPLHWQNLAWAARKGVNIEPALNVMNFPYLGDLVIE